MSKIGKQSFFLTNIYHFIFFPFSRDSKIEKRRFYSTKEVFTEEKLKKKRKKNTSAANFCLSIKTKIL